MVSFIRENLLDNRKLTMVNFHDATHHDSWVAWGHDVSGHCNKVKTYLPKVTFGWFLTTPFHLKQFSLLSEGLQRQLKL